MMRKATTVMGQTQLNDDDNKSTTSERLSDDEQVDVKHSESLSER